MGTPPALAELHLLLAAVDCQGEGAAVVVIDLAEPIGEFQ